MKLYRRPNRKSYYTRVYSGGREKLVCLHTDSKKEAERILARMAYDRLPESIRRYHDRPETPLNNAWDEYLKTESAKACTESTLLSKYRIFDAFLLATKIRTVEKVTPSVAGDYLRDVSERATAATAKRHKSTMSSIWKALWPDRDNPWQQTAPMPVIGPKKYRAFTNEEISAILTVCNAEWRRLVQVGIFTGLRLADAVSVSASQVVGDYIELVPAKTHRSGRKVRIPIHHELDWIRTEKDPYPGILESYRKQVATVSHQFEKILKSAKVTGGKIGFHSLRTTFITRCEQAEIPRSLIQGMVGHSAGKMTGHYSEAVVTSEMIDRIPTVSTTP